jgi:hypothetical protein
MQTIYRTIFFLGICIACSSFCHNEKDEYTGIFSSVIKVNDNKLRLLTCNKNVYQKQLSRFTTLTLEEIISKERPVLTLLESYKSKSTWKTITNVIYNDQKITLDAYLEEIKEAIKNHTIVPQEVRSYFDPSYFKVEEDTLGRELLEIINKSITCYNAPYTEATEENNNEIEENIKNDGLVYSLLHAYKPFTEIIFNTQETEATELQEDFLFYLRLFNPQLIPFSKKTRLSQYAHIVFSKYDEEYEKTFEINERAKKQLPTYTRKSYFLKQL